MRWRPRLQTILLIVNIVILGLPLAGIAVLRIYESALIRQTESELIAQGAFIAAAYRATLSRLREASQDPSKALSPYGIALPSSPSTNKPLDKRWRPRPARLDLATDIIRAPQPDVTPPEDNADPLAVAVGRELTPILRDAQVVTLAGIRVVDYQGVIVASTSEELGLYMAHSEEVQTALRGDEASLLRQRISDEPPPPLESISRGSGIRVFVTTPIIAQQRVLGAVVLSRTPSNIARALYGKRYLLLNLALMLFVVVSLLAIFTSLTISRPVKALIAQAKRAVRGEKGAVTPLTNPVTQEIAQLSEAVAAMAQTLEQRADYIRTFAAHVSHEFKTPLTAIQGAVELLREHFDTMSAQERQRFLDNLHQDAERLERLVRRLLELARADVMTGGEEAADVALVTDQVIKRFRRQGMQIRTELDPDLPLAAIGEETLNAILTNLLDNARQHGGQAVTVEIGIGTTQTPQPQVIIKVTDNGPGISEANAERIFEPFFTTSRKQGGTGLGLAVVKSLLAAHGGRIELLPTEIGATFRIWLRVA